MTQTPPTNFPSHGGSTGNLALIGQVVLEKTIFENGGRMDRRMDNRLWLYYKLTNEPKGSGELIIRMRGQEVSPKYKINPEISSSFATTEFSLELT